MPPEPSGNIELVPTSNTPQPQAQANAAPGANTPANKPPPIFFIREFKFLFFMFKVKSCEHATRHPRFKRDKTIPTSHDVGRKNCEGLCKNSARRRHRRPGER